MKAGCGSDEIDCSAPAGSCVSGGACLVACDPANIQNPPYSGPAGDGGVTASAPRFPQARLHRRWRQRLYGSGACVTCLLSETSDGASSPEASSETFLR